MAPEEKKVPHPIKAHPLWALYLFNKCYAPDQQSRKSPAVSPYYTDAEEFSLMTAFVTCEGGTLRPEANQLAEMLQIQKNNSQNVVFHVLEGVPHGLDKGAEDGTLEWVRREEAYSLAIKLLKEVFDR
ncbi:hypothetical protein BKA67DRAFT_542104 [Truncatella angustata]|uniref:Alpha/beta hydrolase fold-3 domain-containing protein n=1 Tax=Truncatella angustata TaxID=152316 RepID=A0A9P8UBZ2_9PEZI|nr:uncharacterized protein BKA67DRAFT_542104 [Truncatella angustata]KAH6645127.1 hypothetical protein BKA67DRAFT_542104 [Truncatella angustata]